MFLIVDVLALAVLLPIDLTSFLRSEMSAVGLPFGVNLLICPCLLPFETLGLARVQLTRRYTLRNTALLVVTPSVHPVHRSGCWSSAVRRGQLAAILTCVLLVRHLVRSRLEMMLVHRRTLLRIGLCSDSTLAIEARSINIRVIHYSSIDIRIVNDRRIYVGHSSVVVEGIPAPLSADKTDTPIAEAIVDTAVEAHVRTPVTGVPRIQAAGKAPIARESTRFLG